MTTNAQDCRVHWRSPWYTGFFKHQFLRDTLASQVRFTERALRIWKARAFSYIQPCNVGVFEIWSRSIIVLVSYCEPYPLLILEFVFKFSNKGESIFFAKTISLHFLVEEEVVHSKPRLTPWELSPVYEYLVTLRSLPELKIVSVLEELQIGSLTLGPATVRTE
jgi:hypothetical protein